MTDSAGLAGDASAGDGADDIESAGGLGELKGLTNDEFKGVKAEIILNVAAVDGYRAGSVRINADAGNRTFSSAGTVEVRVGIIHSLRPPSESAYPGFGSLSLVFVVCASIDVAAGEALRTYAVCGEHAFDGELHCESGVLSHKGFVVDLFEMAYITGVMTVHLLDEFVAGEDSFLSVDDYDVVAAVGMRSKINFMFAAEKGGGGGSSAAEGFACCVKNIPFALDSSGIRHSGGHSVYLHCIFLCFFFRSESDKSYYN